MSEVRVSRISDRVRRSALRPAVAKWRHRGLSEDDVLLASYPRSGNTWAKFMLAELLVGSTVDFASNSKVIPMIGNHRAVAPLLPGGGRLVKTHEPYRLEYRRAIYLVRDIRDVALSFYKFRGAEGFDDGEFDEFVAAFIDGRVGGYGTWPSHVSGWLDAHDRGQAEVLVVNYERLLSAPVDRLQEMAGFLGIPAEPSVIAHIVANNTTDKMRSRPADASSDWMRGTVGAGSSGSWRNRYTDQQLHALEPARGAMHGAGYDVEAFPFD